ncbi:MAG: hypothetical protein K0S33_462 [Bacteroidetes bacterium]|jgi:antitoxin component YwqK of YwqJK toxin-antitoxin module|nr:hypothetical protein [Bacteroidota bacterium]
MKFSITYGTGIVSVRLSEIGSYFRFRKPLTAVWYDCHGSVGKYLCLLPYEKEYREEVRKNLYDNLDVDYTSKEAELKTLLDPLLKLFPNGDYSLNFYTEESEYFKTHLTEYAGETYYDWSVINSPSNDIKDIEEKKKKHEEFMADRESQGEMTWDLLEYTTPGFYDGCSLSFVATQPQEELDPERIQYYEEQIRVGKRPFAIICKAYYYKEIPDMGGISVRSFESENYILDGHHKLAAYSNLKVAPRVAEIMQVVEDLQETQFDILELIEVLYPWQIDHILQNWDDKETYIKKFLEDPQSKIHQFIKNGIIKEFHKNGQLKHEAFYINDHIEGEAKWWFDNGRLKEIRLYKDKRPAGEWKSWFKSGQLEFVQPFNEAGNYHGHMVSYHENGQARWEQFLENGQNKDGYSYLVWYDDGRKEAELKYSGGRMTERKNYDRSGKLINFEELDPVQNRLVKRK